MLEKHQYLLRVQFLGFRYSGWQRQPGERTVEEMLLKTLRFVLPGKKTKLLGAGRTDARVSALDFGLQLMVTGGRLDSEAVFLEEMNRNLPPDIRLLSVRKVPLQFNAIRDCTEKVYRYFFALGAKPHPFCAPFMGYFPGDIDIEAMKKGALFFVGDHDFRAFTAGLSGNTSTRRSVTQCHIGENREVTASFFPRESYCLTVAGRGFGRYQVRRMMAALVALGRGGLTEEDLLHSLETGNLIGLKDIAPGSGLQLIQVEFDIGS